MLDALLEDEVDARVEAVEVADVADAVAGAERKETMAWFVVFVSTTTRSAA